MGTPESKAGKSEYAQFLSRALFRYRGRDLSIRDVQNVARWLPHDDDLLLVTGKEWFFGDYPEGAAADVLEEQHARGRRAFLATVEHNLKVREPFLLCFTKPSGTTNSNAEKIEQLVKSGTTAGDIVTVRVANVAKLSLTARMLEESGYAAPQPL